MSEHRFETRDIALGGIAVLPDRMRALRPEVVDALAESMKVQGLLHPVVLRPSDATGYYLVVGRHRLEAARKLEWNAIPSRIIDMANADIALLAEIDENLIRSDLSPAERAAHQAARKVVYERMHPETKKGATGISRKKSQVATSNPAPAFIDDCSKKTGVHRATVARETARGESIHDVASLAGTSLDKGDELDALAKLAKLAPEKQCELIDRAIAGEKVSAKVEIKKEKRTERERDLGQRQLALPQKKYGVIVADPEWRFEPRSRETGLDRAADNHYPTSCTDVIAARDVSSIAADDCVLFLWATAPMLPHAQLVMAAWGFDYRSNYVWAKDRIGTGYWGRNKHEHLLIGVRGKIPAPAPGTQWDSLIEAPVGEHSDKPECFLEMIEFYFPNLPKIELNRRGPPRPGWDAWGNEADSSNKSEQSTNGQREEGLPRLPAAMVEASQGLEAALLEEAPQGGAEGNGEPDQGIGEPDLPTFLTRGHSDCIVKS